MSSGGAAPTSSRIYRWMSEPAGARAMGLSIEAIRQSVITGSLKARVTPAGISQVLVCLNPWVAADDNGENIKIESTDRPDANEVSPSPPAAGPFAHALAGMHGREKITWAVVTLAFLLLVGLTFHAAKTQAAAEKWPLMTRANRISPKTGEVGEIQHAGIQQKFISMNSDATTSVSLAPRPEPRHPIQTTMAAQQSPAMNDDLPPGFQLGALSPTPPKQEFSHRVMSFERQDAEEVGAVPATPLDGAAPPAPVASPAMLPDRAVGSGDFSALQDSNLLIGSQAADGGILLSEANAAPALPFGALNLSPISSANDMISRTDGAGFHLKSKTTGDSGSAGSQSQESSPDLGAEPPDLGAGNQSAPEPGGMLLLPLGAAPILFARRRGIYERVESHRSVVS